MVQPIERPMCASCAFVGHQRLEMGRLLDLLHRDRSCAGDRRGVWYPSTMRTRSSVARISSGRPRWVCGMRVIVQIEAQVRSLARDERATRSSVGKGLSGNGSKRGRSSTNTARTLRSRSSGHGRSAASSRHHVGCLGVQLTDIFELPGSKKSVASKTYCSFHAPFFVPARDRHRARLEPVMSGQLQQRRMEADRLGFAARAPHF